MTHILHRQISSANLTSRSMAAAVAASAVWRETQALFAALRAHARKLM
jgi:hypothetical protein